MPKATLSKHYDYYQAGARMVSYEPGDYDDMPQSHYDAAVEVGAVKGVEPPKAEEGESKRGLDSEANSKASSRSTTR